MVTTMTRGLRISIGQHSDRGRKPVNQDFHGVLVPEEPQLSLKGIAAVLADGISSSTVSQIASESAVKSFLMDYYCTSESWTVKTSARRVLDATNSWLHAQTRKSQYAYDRYKGYVCTLSTRIVREIHGSSRSHIYLAVDAATDEPVALKLPSIDLRDNAAYLKRFLMEEWIARRIDSPHVLKPLSQSRRRGYLYVATEFIEGQTLRQWMIDHPRPDLETVRGIVEQIAVGLRAFH